MDQTFESLYNKFLIDTYGENFFKYIIYLNTALAAFVIFLSCAFYIENQRNKK